MKQESNDPLSQLVCPPMGKFPLPDDPFLADMAKLSPAMMGECLTHVIQMTPQTLLCSPLLADFLRRNNLASFTMDAINLDVGGFTTGHAEVHALAMFELHEKPSTASPSGRGISGALTAIFMREGVLVLDVQYVQMLPVEAGKN